MCAQSLVGFYGKLPSHGDFLRRRVDDDFVARWDGWLQQCLAESRLALGDGWLNVYLTSPAWRFVCAAGALGPTPVAGLMVPSVDRVGRYFPLTIVAELPQNVSPVSIATAAQSFYDNAQRLLIETLEADDIDFDRFDEGVEALAVEVEAATGRLPLTLDVAALAALNGGTGSDWRIPLAFPPDLAPAFEQVLAQHLTSLYDPLALWWTDGSSIVEPSCLITKGLPRPDSFAAMLDGSWTEREWNGIAADIQAPLMADPLAADEATPPRYRSAGATNVGCVRSVNQDSFLDRAEVGLWAVADGLGGHRDGEIASRMVCDALADILPDAGFEDVVDAVNDRIQAVNGHLVRAAELSVDDVRCGSTVVTLLTRGTRCAVLWAGDSRLYRWRDGQLQQLTRDHSPDDVPSSANGHRSNAVTRAVGAEPTLTLDVVRDRVTAGDRFLLCSDGLTRVVEEARITEWLQQDIESAVSGLIAATLDAGAPDNVTVLVVEAFS
jgi:type VI secretion system protein ImpM